jgi:5-formyltetrahydrofolate cyclo-ligase
MNIQTQKQILRTKFLALRKAMPEQERIHANKTIIATLQKTREYINAKTICTYVSLSDEVDTATLIKNELEKNEKICVVPKVAGSILRLYAIHAWSDLTPGVFGLLEPKTTLTQISPEDIDLFVIPGLVFDITGHRLGYGKGYYDKLLIHTNVPKIALAYDLQVIDAIPHESTDIPVHICITEKQQYQF